MSSNIPEADAIEQPLIKHEKVASKAWDGSSNYHKKYDDCGIQQKKLRDTHLHIILRHWQTLDVDRIIPAELQPPGLPDELRDCGGPWLEALAALAKVTRNDLRRAQKFLRRALVARGGADGDEIGVEDIKYARDLVLGDNGAKKGVREHKAKEKERMQQRRDGPITTSASTGVSATPATGETDQTALSQSASSGVHRAPVTPEHKALLPANGAAVQPDGVIEAADTGPIDSTEPAASAPNPGAGKSSRGGWTSILWVLKRMLIIAIVLFLAYLFLL